MSASASANCERILAFSSGEIWARFSDASSICLHASGATFSTCGGPTDIADVNSNAGPDRRCQVTRFSTHAWRDKLRVLLRFRNSLCPRTLASLPLRPQWTTDSVDVGADLRPLLDAELFDSNDSSEFFTSPEYIKYARFPAPPPSTIDEHINEAELQQRRILFADHVSICLQTGVVQVRSVCGHVRLCLAAPHGQYFRVSFPAPLERCVTLNDQENLNVVNMLNDLPSTSSNSGRVSKEDRAEVKVGRQVRYQRMTQLHAASACPDQWRYPLLVAVAVLEGWKSAPDRSKFDASTVKFDSESLLAAVDTSVVINTNTMSHHVTVALPQSLALAEQRLTWPLHATSLPFSQDPHSPSNIGPHHSTALSLRHARYVRRQLTRLQALDHACLPDTFEAPIPKDSILSDSELSSMQICVEWRPDATFWVLRSRSPLGQTSQAVQTLIHADDSVLWTQDGQFVRHYLTQKSLGSAMSAFASSSMQCLYSSMAVPLHFNSTVPDAPCYELAAVSDHALRLLQHASITPITSAQHTSMCQPSSTVSSASVKPSDFSSSLSASALSTASATVIEECAVRGVGVFCALRGGRVHATFFDRTMVRLTIPLSPEAAQRVGTCADVAMIAHIILPDGSELQLRVPQDSDNHRGLFGSYINPTLEFGQWAYQTTQQRACSAAAYESRRGLVLNALSDTRRLLTVRAMREGKPVANESKLTPTELRRDSDSAAQSQSLIERMRQRASFIGDILSNA